MADDYTNLLPSVSSVDELLGNKTVDGVTSTVRIARSLITTGASEADVNELRDDVSDLTDLVNGVVASSANQRMIYSDFSEDKQIMESASAVAITSTPVFKIYTPSSARAFEELRAVVVLDLGAETFANAVGLLYFQGRRNADNVYVNFGSLNELWSGSAETGVVVAELRVAASATVYKELSIVLQAKSGKTFTLLEHYVVEGLDRYPTPHRVRRTAAIAGEAVARDAAIAASEVRTLATLDAVMASISQPPTSGKAAVKLAAKRRISILMIGDSNQLKDGTGWDDGLNYALGQYYSQYASPLSCFVYNYMDGVGTYSGGYNTGSSASPPSELTALGLPDLNFTSTVQTPVYKSSTSLNAGGSQYGWVADLPQSGGYIHSDLALRYHVSYGKFTSGSGSYKIGARLQGGSYTTIAESPGISTAAAAYGKAVATLDIPAPAVGRSYPLAFTLTTSASVAPTMHYWGRIEVPARATGYSVTTIYGGDGQSLYDMAATFIGYSDQRLANLLADDRYMHEVAHQPPLQVIWINSGVNDQNETSSPSLGPSPSNSPASAAAYVDNLKAIINRFEDIYIAQGWPLAQICFVVIPSHPTTTPEDSDLTGYRSAAAAYAATRERVTVVDFTTLTTATEMLANSYFLLGGSDRFHLTQAGYRALMGLLIASWQ